MKINIIFLYTTILYIGIFGTKTCVIYGNSYYTILYIGIFGIKTCVIYGNFYLLYWIYLQTNLYYTVGAYNAVWRVLEQAMEDERLVACGRYVRDPYNDNVEDRKGEDLGR